MSVITSDYFLAHGYTRFNKVDPTFIQYWLDAAALSYVPASLWGVHRIAGIMLCAAHFLEMEWAQTIETSGNATAIASGSGARTPTGSPDDFQLTTWGRRFSFLRKGLMDGSISPLSDEAFSGLPSLGIGLVI